MVLQCAGLPSIPVTLDSLLSAFIGTFVGAYVAFKLEHSSRLLEEVRRRSTEGNLALLTLSRMWNVLTQFQREIIATAPTGGDRWLNMKTSFPQTHTHWEDLRFDPAKLAFIFECDDKNLLPEILLEESRFKLALGMIDRRAHLMLEQILPAMAAAGVQVGQAVSEHFLHAVVGPARLTEARELADGITKNVNEDVESLKAVFSKLRTALVKLLPGEKFIRVDFDPAPATPETVGKKRS